MSKPIYVLVLGYGMTEAWHQLSKEEQDSLWAKVMEIDAQAGAKWLILCDSRWADESVFDWGALEYPDIETYWAKVKALEQLNWWRYFSGKTILGTKMDL